MQPRRYWLPLVLAVWFIPGVALAAEQSDRREHETPELMIDTGSRMGTCDVVQFTPDGRYLLAAGDDKVVRIWEHTAAGLNPKPIQTLRWAVWKQRRGDIYALALSPGREAKYVAIAGKGIRNGAAAVLERSTGKVVQAIVDVEGRNEINNTVTWSVAFSPSGRAVALGKEDGSVWLWKPFSGQKNDVLKLGRHANKGNVNRVRLVFFRNDKQLVSVASDSTVIQWDLDRSPAGGQVLFQFDSPHLFRVVISTDQQWLAAASQDNNRAHSVEIRSLDGGRARKFIELPQGQFPNCLAFDLQGSRLAVGVRVLDQQAKFYREGEGKVFVYDLRSNPPRKLALSLGTSFHPDALAFHPNGQHLAVAGGADQEVTLWDLNNVAGGPLGKPICGPGTGLWGVGLSRDDRYLGFRTQHQSDPPDPNQQGMGSWRVFDLQDRQWAPARNFQPMKPLLQAGGWTVAFDPKDAYSWYAVDPRGKPHRLELDRDFDMMPQCYTFLKADGGKPVRLAVGHLWGFSLFQLDDQGVRRVRLFYGHGGYVTAIAPSADQKILVTASRDQTIAAWSLVDWEKSESPLGARFEERNGKLFVEAVDPGSPAWEAGLTVKDEVIQFAYAGKEIKSKPPTWLTWLKQPVPNREYFFKVQTKTGEAKLSKTTVRERPLWHFFPTQPPEGTPQWVLWRHFDCYYDASPSGDQLIGWQLSYEVDQTPKFFPVREFSKTFFKPEKIAEALHETRFAPQLAQFLDLKPPELTLQPSVAVVKDRLEVTFSARPRGDRDAHKPHRLELWIDDYRYRVWPNDKEKLPAKGEFRCTVPIPPDKLRFGVNRLTLQCESNAGTRSTLQITVQKPGKPAPSNLFLVEVGIVNYENAKLPAEYEPFDNLGGIQIDFADVRRAWEKQQGQQFGKIIPTQLLNEEVTSANVLAALQAVANQATPDDVLVLFLNGHGYTQPQEGKENQFKKGTFIFVGPHFDIANPTETGLSADLLYDGLTRVPCRKLVLLNACHAGDAARNTLRGEPVRDLTPGGVGPIVLSAAQQHEDALTDEDYGSPFAQAIEEALTNYFSRAAAGKNQLDTNDLVAYVIHRVPELVRAKDPTKIQTPICFPELPEMARFALARQTSGTATPLGSSEGARNQEK